MTNVMDEIMNGVLTAVNSPLRPIESFITLTPEEAQILAENLARKQISSAPGLTTREEFLTIYRWAQIPAELHANFELTFKKAQLFEQAYGHELRWTSVWRSKEHHQRVYDGINAKRKALGQAPLTVPWGSKHLKFLAWDCSPVKESVQHLQDWVKSQEHNKMEEIGLYFEDFSVTKDWVHAQVVPFGSYVLGGTRFFKI